MTFKDFADGLVVGANAFVVPLLMTVAFLVFVWGVVKYFILHSDSEEERRKGRSFILWGVLGFVLIFSIWGVINILLDTLGFSGA